MVIKTVAAWTTATVNSSLSSLSADKGQQFEQISKYLDQADDHIWKHDERKAYNIEEWNCNKSFRCSQFIASHYIDGKGS